MAQIVQYLRRSRKLPSLPTMGQLRLAMSVRRKAGQKPRLAKR